ncbi:hypothetical protein [Yersinia pseudotuberculosis]|uniref:hypothetical protein n=1 Tax=Yersinia pseudotuberculosis TaxID=633 RepID=UPI00070989B1|nr:hypothetical protein [Yersinia pseudotuberculosis]AXY32297.1 hypothetical protein CEQ20_02035 [Yersinia pseudotuberculosis]AYX11970.1 hypothetical protein EGX52_15020 [Yersinia pseudotuberculosis]MBO1567059.1 hypothetical protein [Yersinia pseudotuberculosis]MBO1603918.1 hypothetical protein [Yersinia pseudotuberculosis]PEI11868.1 hypothetical protein CRM78_00575 [Yersinia pseudotuberculosis]
MSKKIKKIDKLSIIFNASDKRRARRKMFSRMDEGLNKRITVLSYFDEMNAAEIYLNHKRIKNHSYFSKLPLIQKNNKIEGFYANIVPSTSLDKSISYILASINECIDDLNFFLGKEKEITWLILNSDYSSAKKIADEIYEKFGHSVWYYTLNSTIADLEDDYESKKEILDDVYESKNEYFKYIVRNVSSRHDKTGAFLQNIDSFKGSLETLPKNISEHLIYKLAPLDYRYEYDFEIIMNEEKNTCIIDAYKSLVKYLLHRTHYNHNEMEFLPSRIVSFLSKNTDCPISKQLSKAYNENSFWDINEEDYEILDNYTLGNYKDVCEQIEQRTEFLSVFPFFELYTKSLERINKGFKNIGGNFIDVGQGLSSIYKKDKNYVKSYNHLLSICFSLEDLPWFVSLSLLVLQEDRFSEGLNNIKAVHNLISPLDSPQKSIYLSEEQGIKLINSALNKHPNSSSLYLYRKIRNNEIITDDILKDEFRRDKYNAIIHMRKMDYPAAIKLLNSTSCSVDRLTENEYSELLGKCYLLSASTSDAVKFAMNKIIKNRSLFPLFNVKEICVRIKEEINTLNDIHVPNFLSIYTRYIDDEFKPILRYGLESFFIKNNLKSLDELFLRKELFDEEQLNYFLEFVCVPDLMKLTLLFHGTKKTETNRIKICSYLVENNKNEAISEELKTLAKSQVLNIASKQVDHSKIYADTSKLRTQDNSGLNELYNQFLNLKAKDYSDNEVERFLENLIDMFVTPNDKFDESVIMKDLRGVYVIGQSNNEKNDLFEKLLIRIRDEFVFGTNGLNINLSTRIRHGHFPSTLRKSLLEENLITTQIKSNSEFKANDYWMSNLKFDSESDYEKANNAFKNFSKEFESIIAEANVEWFQIKIFNEAFNKLIDSELKSKRHALFDFSLSIIELYYIQTVYASYNSYADFIRSVIEWFWKKTDNNLIDIRAKINSTLRMRVFDAIKSLQQGIHEIINDETVTHEFNNAIGRCKESMNVNIETISSWFMRSEQSEIATFDFDTLIEISRRAADITVKSDMPALLKFKGRTLSSFVDVLYMIFENAKTKSLLKKDDVDINISLLHHDNDNAELTISNRCKEISDIEKENRNLEEYRHKYISYINYLTFAQGEGNTGLIKIAKILNQDLELNHIMTIGYTSNDTFEIKFTFYDFSKVIDNADIDC